VRGQSQNEEEGEIGSEGGPVFASDWIDRHCVACGGRGRDQNHENMAGAEREWFVWFRLGWGEIRSNGWRCFPWVIRPSLPPSLGSKEQHLMAIFTRFSAPDLGEKGQE